MFFFETSIDKRYSFWYSLISYFEGDKLNTELLIQKFFILGKFLTYPTKELKDDIKKIIAQIKNKDETKKLKNILSLLNNETYREELEAEYTSLFITGYPKTPCPPYFSAYQTGMIVSDYSDKLYDLYEEYGIELSNEQFPDFIPTMMEFMTLLLTNDLLEEAKNFYKEYLSWLDEFSKNIKRNTKNEYFIMIANELDNFTKDINHFFNL